MAPGFRSRFKIGAGPGRCPAARAPVSESDRTVFAPTTVDEAFRLLAEHRDSATLLAGGQSLMPTLKLRLVEPGCLIDLDRIPVLWPMRATDDSDWRLAGAAGVCAAGGGASGRHRLGRRRLRAGGRDGRRRSRMANCICSCLSVWKRASCWARRSPSSCRLSRHSSKHCSQRLQKPRSFLLSPRTC
jgi:hypothetical protein